MADVLTSLQSALADRYLIERELGQGGMATVYLAHDLRHDRKVALKVLRPELAAILGGERFLAEIKTTANLQHPHILSLFDSGEAGGMVYYVMPFVEGESVRDRLQRERQLPVEVAVRLAIEVADALAYAHEHGIVHRDIKPENILLHGGHALVADFGIALAASRSDGGTRMTETGMSLGTPHYMAPEQAMGEREITPRADVYALGCVLYEMLVGEPPFNGPTAQAIIARVMTEQPRSLVLQRHTVPPEIEAVVNRALEKLPADRFASAADFRDALANPAAFTRSAPTGTAAFRAVAAPGGRDWRSRVAIPALVAALVLGAAAVWAFLRPHPPAPVSRYGLALPSRLSVSNATRLAISPDGSHLVFTARSVGLPVGQLYLRARDSEQAIALPGTLGAGSATFSPDGRWIAFTLTDGTLRKQAVSGGAAILVADSVSIPETVAWLDDGTIVYTGHQGRGLWRTSAVDRGTPRPVWPADSGLVGEVSSLPGSRGVFFVRCNGSGCASGIVDLWVLDLASGTAREVMPGALLGRYLDTGHVLFVRTDGAALVMPFDLKHLRASGSPVPVLDSIAIRPGGYAQLDVSRQGMLVMLRGSRQGEQEQLLWVDRSGKTDPVDSARVQLTGNGNAGWSFSPDGRRLAISLQDAAGAAIWVKQLPDGPLSRVTFDSTLAFRPRWMADGRTLSYIGGSDSGLALYSVPADGTGRSRLLMRTAGDLYEGAQSPDGRWIVVRTAGGVGRVGRDILGYRKGDTAAVPLMANPAYDESAFAVSPDSRWIAYESDETGRREVYLRPFPATDGGKWQVSTSGGMAPVWARTGRELFFVDGQRRMTAVSVAGGPAPELGGRKTLFTLSPDDYLDDNTYYAPFDVGPDGRFIMARQVRVDADTPPLIVVENWLTELRQRLAK